MKKKWIYTGLIAVVVAGAGWLGGMTAGFYLMKPPAETPRTALETVYPNQYGSYLAGMMAQKNQDYAQTTYFFERALLAAPDNKKLKTTLYLLYAIQGQMDRAIPLAKALDSPKHPENLTHYVLMGDALKRSDWPAMQDLLDQPFDFGPDTILHPVLQAWTYAGQGQWAQAEQALAPLKKTKDMRAFYEYYRALLAMSRLDNAGAITAFQAMSALSAGGYPSLSVLVIMPAFLERQGLWRAGLQEYDQMQKLITKNRQLINLFQSARPPEKITPQIGAAIAFYDISVGLAPLKIQETSLVLNEIAAYLAPEALTPKIWGGELFESAQNYQAANRVYSQIKNPGDVVRLKAALNFIANRDYGGALPILEKLAAENKTDGLLFSVLGDTYLQTQDYESAIEAYGRATKLLETTGTPAERASALLSLGAAYDKAGLNKSAETALQDALKITPDDPQILNYLGYVWLDRGVHIDQAFDMVRRAAELAPEDPNITDSLALGYYLKHDYDKALELAEKATDALAYSSVAYAHLGDIYAALGRRREATHQYQKALDLKSDLTPKLQAELEKKIGD